MVNSRIAGAALCLAAALCAIVLFSASALAQNVPAIEHPVTDNANVLSDDDEASLGRVLVAHRSATQVQIAVLTVQTTGGAPIDDYSMRVAERWGGGGAGRDQGVLFVLAVRDHRSRIEVGYGLESRLTDSDSRTILDSVRPRLRANDFGGAVRDVVTAIVRRTTPAGATAVVDRPGGATATEDASTATTPATSDPSLAGNGTLQIPVGAIDPTSAAPPPPLRMVPAQTHSRDSEEVCFLGFFLVLGLVIILTIVSKAGQQGRSYSSSGQTDDSSSSFWSSSSSSGSSSSDWSSSSSYDSGSSSSSDNSSSWGGDGGSFGGGGASSDW